MGCPLRQAAKASAVFIHTGKEVRTNSSKNLGMVFWFGLKAGLPDGVF
jgi:hypothetical protein